MSTRKYPSRYEKLKKKNNKKQEKKIESQKAFIDKFVINIKQDTKKKKKDENITNKNSLIIMQIVLIK